MQAAIKFTIADVEALPDRLDDTRYEVIDGELSVAHQPHWDHQFVSLTLGSALLVWSRRTKLGVPNAAPGLIFSPQDDVAPDILWISYARLDQGLRPDGRLYAAPEVVAEILSPGATNERRDRDLKLKLYAREGVDEYWLIDWRIRTVEIYRRAGAMLEAVETLTGDHLLTSPLLPGFVVALPDLWPPPHS